MLTALEQGVKGGKWFSLNDKVYRPANLRNAFARVKANQGAAGVDHQTIEMFEQHLEANLEYLATALKDGSYRPLALLRKWIAKLGSSEKRPLGIPTVRDRVVQTAMRAVLEPIFERIFAAHSYGFRPGRGCKDALRRVNYLLRQGGNWVVDADLKSYFDTIPFEPLLARVKEQVADGAVLALIEAYLHQGVLEAMNWWQPEAGTPQGAVISPLLSNIYLNPLDHLLAQQGMEMVRYADDFVILCRSEAEAQRALALVQQFDTIYLEDLQVANLVRNRHLAKSISDAGWAQFRVILAYKAACAGKRVVAVPPAFTSQDCSGCGERVAKSLSMRTHICTNCGLVLDRDENVARNIQWAGQALRGVPAVAGAMNREPTGL